MRYIVLKLTRNRDEVCYTETNKAEMRYVIQKLTRSRDEVHCTETNQEQR
jgi:hypothetical protein